MLTFANNCLPSTDISRQCLIFTQTIKYLLRCSTLDQGGKYTAILKASRAKEKNFKMSRSKDGDFRPQEKQEN